MEKGIKLGFVLPEQSLCQGKLLIMSHQNYILL